MVKIDTICQILDTVAFLMVTPDFMSEQRLATIRINSDRARKFIGKWGQWTLVGIQVVFPVLAITLLICWALGFRSAQNELGLLLMGPGSHLVVLNDIAWATGGVYLFVVAAFVTTQATWFLARRGTLFWLGALVFFVSRALSVWATVR